MTLTVCKLIAGFLFILSSVTVIAEELTVVTEDWPPYNYMTESGVAGIATDIVKATLAKAEISIQNNTIELLPWARAYRQSLDKKNVLIYTILRTPEREELFYWIGPIVPSQPFHFYKHRDSLCRVEHLEDAKKYQIGVLRNSIDEQFLSSHHFPEKSINPIYSQNLNMKKLLKDHLDLIIDSDETLRMRCDSMNLDYNEFEQLIVAFEKEYYMALSRHTSTATVTRINQAFNELAQSGLISSTH